MKTRIPIKQSQRSSEGTILREILDALRKMGEFAIRLNSGKVRVRGGWMQLCPEGTPDILVLRANPVYRYKVVWIETKTPKGKQGEAQVRFQEDAACRGEFYLLARSLDDVLKAF